MIVHKFYKIRGERFAKRLAPNFSANTQIFFRKLNSPWLDSRTESLFCNPTCSQ